MAIIISNINKYGHRKLNKAEQGKVMHDLRKLFFRHNLIADFTLR